MRGSMIARSSSSQGAPVASRYPASQPRCPADPSPRSSDACKDVQGGLHAEFLSPVGIVPGERQEPEAAIGERGHAPISDLSEQFLGLPDQSYPSEKSERISLSPPVPDLPIRRKARFEVLHRPHVVALPQLQVPQTKRRLAPDADRGGPSP